MKFISLLFIFVASVTFAQIKPVRKSTLVGGRLVYPAESIDALFDQYTVSQLSPDGKKVMPREGLIGFTAFDGGRSYFSLINDGSLTLQNINGVNLRLHPLGFLYQGNKAYTFDETDTGIARRQDLPIVYQWAKEVKKPSYNWSEIGAKPENYPPAVHTQGMDTISGLQDALEGKQPLGDYLSDGKSLSRAPETNYMKGDLLSTSFRYSTFLGIVEKGWQKPTYWNTFESNAEPSLYAALRIRERPGQNDASLTLRDFAGKVQLYTDSISWKSPWDENWRNFTFDTSGTGIVRHQDLTDMKESIDWIGGAVDDFENRIYALEEPYIIDHKTHVIRWDTTLNTLVLEEKQ